MQVRGSKWEKCRGQFTEEERELMRGLAVSIAICPPIYEIKLGRLPIELAAKLVYYLGEGKRDGKV